MDRRLRTTALVLIGGGLVAAVLLFAVIPRPRPMTTVLEAPTAAEVRTLAVTEQDIDDLKAVFATVRSKDRIEARVRIAGTVAELKTDAGRHVEAGDVLALVADQKIALRLTAIEAQIRGARSRAETAKVEMDRATELLRRGVSSQARVDQLKTAYDTAFNEVKAAEAEKAVAARQLEEGQVLAPAAGRVLRVPVTVGTVVMPGESVATIAANEYLLRIELPERHARFMKIGDPVRVGTRGLAPDGQAIGEGRIVQVYPELQGGRVVADAEARGLGDYFVGERTLVWISAGKRRAIVVPRSVVFKRFGLDHVRLLIDKAAALDIIVQLGGPISLTGGIDGVEVLAGLKPGDKVIVP